MIMWLSAVYAHSQNIFCTWFYSTVSTKLIGQQPKYFIKQMWQFKTWSQIVVLKVLRYQNTIKLLLATLELPLTCISWPMNSKKLNSNSVFTRVWFFCRYLRCRSTGMESWPVVNRQENCFEALCLKKAYYFKTSVK